MNLKSLPKQILKLSRSKFMADILLWLFVIIYLIIWNNLKGENALLKVFGECGVKIEGEERIYLSCDVLDDPLEILIAKEVREERE